MYSPLVGGGGGGGGGVSVIVITVGLSSSLRREPNIDIMH